MGHAALFFAIGIVSFILCAVVALGIAYALHPEAHRAAGAPMTPTATEIHYAAVAQLVSYILTFAISFAVFPLMWHKSFLNGISWTFRAARLHWWKLVLLGIAISLIAGASEHLFKTPKDIDILKLLDTPASAWFTAIFGALIAPLVEEVAFRGFLLPAIATAYDWISLERTPAAVMRWQQTTSHTTPALVMAAVLSSAAFAALHGSQLHWPVGPLAILFCVSLAFSTVRIRLHSVAASALVHVSYNSLIFIGIIVGTGGFRHLDKLTR